MKKGHAHFDFLDPPIKKHTTDLSEDPFSVNNHYRPPVNKELAEVIICAPKLP